MPLKSDKPEKYEGNNENEGQTEADEVNECHSVIY
jgi:hypothetical protein